MRILFVGDVFGKPGRRALQEKLHGLLYAHSIDFCIANVENAAGGFGLTPAIAQEFLDMGIDVLTTGNHVWDKKAIIPFIAEQPRLLRPLNYPDGAPGTGFFLGNATCGIPLAVLNIQGRVFMPSLDCPFRAGDAAIEEARRRTPIVIVDFHAEASSEKQAFAWYQDGKASAVIGTHTHVPTADERILPQGTAFITDVGMTGPYDSVIGSIPGLAIDRFLHQMPNRLEPSHTNVRLCAVVLDIDDSNGRANSIERLSVPADQ